MIKIISVVFVTLIFAGCGKYDLENRINLANTISQKHHFKSQDIQAGTFALRTYQKFNIKNSTLKIYIEGDGFAWVDRYTISSNPTPVNPVALKLAVNDKASNIVYIARPCQYIQSDNCNDKYWSDKRFSKEVIDSVNEVINKLKKQSQSKDIKLIGFSGGGAIAVLVASKRDDVKSIVTIAGNLNHKLLHQHHNIPPMYGSLNPIDIASKISNISQTHYVGEKDKIVPVKIANSFKKASNGAKDIKIIIVPNATHTKGWDNFDL